MTNNMKSQAYVTVTELAARVDSQTEAIEKKVSDALFEQSGAHELRLMCRGNPETSADFDCVEQAAHLHGFLDDGEEIARPEEMEGAV